MSLCVCVADVSMPMCLRVCVSVFLCVCFCFACRLALMDYLGRLCSFACFRVCTRGTICINASKLVRPSKHETVGCNPGCFQVTRKLTAGPPSTVNHDLELHENRRRVLSDHQTQTRLVNTHGNPCNDRLLIRTSRCSNRATRTAAKAKKSNACDPACIYPQTTHIEASTF